MIRRILLAAAIALGLVLGWLAAPLVLGGVAVRQAEPVAPKPVAPKPTAPEPVAPAPAAPEPTINPPPQIPEVEIPPIPQVDEADPFAPATPKKAVPGPAPGLEEGKRLFNREGRVAVDDAKHTVFVFDSGDKPMRLLENSWREFLESVTDLGKKDAHWRVSGLITVYQQQNYLLLTKCIRMMPEEEGR